MKPYGETLLYELSKSQVLYEIDREEFREGFVEFVALEGRDWTILFVKKDRI